MSILLRVLIVQDSADDTGVLLQTLRETAAELTRWLRALPGKAGQRPMIQLSHA